MNEIGLIGFLLILINVIVSYKGFSTYTFINDYKFEVDRILISKEYKRLITSGFLHANWNHLIFNMITLYLFSGALEYKVDHFYFLLIYTVSLVGGNLFALYIHKSHGDYSAVGASGAVCGVIFAFIALFPDMGIGFILIPISIPSWLYGILYIGYSIYGIQSKKDNIGHEAHLGGALIGMLAAIVLFPDAIIKNYITILIITVPTLIFIYLIVTKPSILLVPKLTFKTKNAPLGFEHKYNENKMQKQKELNKLLDKINKKGIKSLSKKEKEKLKNLS